MADRHTETQVNPPVEGVERSERLDPETDDDALMLWMLSLTPAGRLAAAQGFADSVRPGRPPRAATNARG
jgi:hypothetical protein